MCTFGINELYSRLQPDNQVLYVAPEDSEEYDNILKIYAWENVWNADKSVETTVLTEMKIGEILHTGAVREARNIDGAITENYCDVFFYTRFDPLGEVILIAESDGILEAEYSTWNRAHRYCKPESNYLIKGNLEMVGEHRSNYSLMISAVTYHDQDGLDSDNTKALNKSVNSYKWNEELAVAYNKVSTEFLRDIYPNINNSIYGNFSRKVYESAVKITAYDKNDPAITTAYAIVKFTLYSAWENTNANMPNGVFYQTLFDLSLGFPDSYGYTTAELVDYWEIEEW
ncbi:MAG: hypothetical protein IJ493_06820 [Clostridia bacterium]|nr:hypothetical protein [Clostridia bacterium]